MGPVTGRQSWSKVNELRKLKKKRLIAKKLEKEALASHNEDSIQKSSEAKVDFSCVKNIKTTSIAVAGSILCNAQSPELKTYLAGQIARAACIYNIDEVVVFNDMGDTPEEGMLFDKEKHKAWKSCIQLERILQYLECPQYLRKHLFPVHPDLQFVGLLNPLEAPHHLRATEKEFPYREGVVSKKPTKSGKGSYVNVGLDKEVLVEKSLEPCTRVTIKILNREGSKKMKGVIVPPLMPKAELGIYWGYGVRLARSFKAVFEECPYKEGYDLVIGTSDKGKPAEEVEFPDFHHSIIVFGGLNGLEFALESDETLNKDLTDIFHFYLNTCSCQGTRTIRTEEAILISLTVLKSKLNSSKSC